MLKDLIIALSTANLCFILTWNELIKAAVRRFNTCLGVVVNVMLLGLLFWALITLARRFGGQRALRMARLLFPLLLLLPLNGMLTILFPRIAPFNTVIILGLAVVVIGLFEIAPWHGYILRTSQIIATVLFPFFLIAMTQASWALINPPAKTSGRAIEGGSQSKKRVLWLLFDEMDQNLAFSNRPESLSLPELDRLRSESIYAANAFPPSDSTSVSVPALIAGKLLSNTEIISQRKLMITVADAAEPVNWSSHPNVFSDAREAGLNTALIGWFLPYCNLIGSNLTQCFWIDTEASNLKETMSKQVKAMIGLAPLVLSYAGESDPATLRRESQIKGVASYIETLQAAKKVIADPSFGMVLVHWPVPHAPSIYNRQNKRFEIGGDSSYLDNLRLVDQTLGELRRDLETAGTWKDTIVLVTSDHCWRPEIWRTTESWGSEDEQLVKAEVDQRVPYILRLPGQQRGMEYEPVFNNVLTRDLVMGLLRGELYSAEDVTRWLDEHRSIGRSPYRFNLSN